MYKEFLLFSYQFSSVQSLSSVRLYATPWTAARQASLSITKSRSPPKPMSIESVMLSNHLILCHPLLLLPSIFPSIRVFSNESALCIKWPKYWSFSFNISPINLLINLMYYLLYFILCISWDTQKLMNMGIPGTKTVTFKGIWVLLLKYMSQYILLLLISLNIHI